MVQFAFIAAFLLTLLFAPVMHAQENLQPHIIRTNADRVHRGGEAFFNVHASAFVRANPQQTWAVLTDYGRLAEFVPDLQSSTVLSRTTNKAVIEQRSKAGFLFVSHDIHTVLQIDEQAFSTIDVALVSGNMKHYTARWQLTPFSQEGLEGTLISFSAEIEPDFFIPPLIGDAIVERNVRQMVQAVVRKIERRSAH